MPIEPISATIIGVAALARILSGRAKKNERQNYENTYSRYNRLIGELETRTDGMMQTVTALGHARTAHAARHLRRLVRVSRQLGLRNAGDISEAELDHLVALADRVEELRAKSPAKIDRTIDVAAVAAVAVQGIEALDQFHLVEIPLLDERLGDLLGGTMPDLGGTVLDGLGGVADLSVADALGIFALFYSVYRVGSNLHNASKLAEANAQLGSAVAAVEEKLASVNAIGERAGRLLQGVQHSSYEAFKWSWISGELKRSWRPSHRRFRKTAFRTFIEARDCFVAYERVPLVTDRGTIHHAPLPPLVRTA